MKEERYAILVGINNYKIEPLEFAVKDAKDLKDVLVSRCKFKEENIISIIDTRLSVLQQLNEAYNRIKKRVVKNSDTLLFYFSGHGEYDKMEEKSLLVFEDNSAVQLEKILAEYIMPIKAKNYYLIIDACYSGANINFKEKSISNKKKERKLAYDSKELYFLFASQSLHKAYQDSTIKQSIYTHQLIQAINDDNFYDDDGFLTMAAIDNYIRKSLTEYKQLVQIPTTESRVSGYKPFAFLPQKQEIVKKTIPHQIINQMNNSSLEAFNLNDSLSDESRQSIWLKINELFAQEISHSNFEQFSNKYSLIKRGTDGMYSSDIKEELEKGIIKAARAKKLDAINGMFEVNTYTAPNRIGGLNNMFDIMYGKPEPETTMSYTIYYDDRYVLRNFIEFQSNDVNYASGGLYLICYQAKYGLAFGRAFFKYVWEGTHEKISNVINIALTPFVIKEESIGRINLEMENSVSELSQWIEKWNKERQSEIKEFLDSTK